jgi:hypothetical protein
MEQLMGIGLDDAAAALMGGYVYRCKCTRRGRCRMQMGMHTAAEGYQQVRVASGGGI